MTAPAPGSDAWWRVVTASKVAGIIGVSPYESPRSVWHKMRGDIPADTRPPTAAMHRGNILEPAVLAWWIDRHPEAVVIGQQSYRSLEAWCAATVDLEASIADELVLVEAKTAARDDEWGPDGTDLIPVHYLTQVYWQLAMAPEAVRAYVAVLLGPGLEFREYVIERDEDIQSDLVARCREFYASTRRGDPPPLDDTVATVETLKALHPEINGTTVPIDLALAHEWLTAKAHTEAAKARERAAESLIRDLMGEARYAAHQGVRVARRQPGYGGRVSLYAAAKPEHLPQNGATP